VERNSNTISQIPALIVQDASPQMREQAPADSTVDQIHLGGETGHDLAGTLREAGIRFQIAEPGMGTIRPASPASPSQSCVEVIRNPQMDVVEFGDGTGSAEYWTILWQQIYFDNRAGYYRSASHSLAMADDPAVDSDIIDTSLDYDAFGQGFIAPSGLVSITIDYSRMYANMNEGDTAYYGLWTLDSEGYLDSLVVYWTIGGTSGAWQDRHGNLVDTAILAQLSGKSLAFVFDMETDRVAPNETIWVDDTQVTLCFDAGAYQTYMPHAINEPGPSGPTCSPAEPDAVDQRGSVDVGACCNGSFSATDLKDYYSLNLSGVTNVKLGLKDLPTGTNFDALIYQDSSGYPLKCQIGTPGDQDKWRDCPALDLTKVQFILVNAGTAPAPGSNTYTMCLLPQ
jgi:hypothetical protein